MNGPGSLRRIPRRLGLSRARGRAALELLLLPVLEASLRVCRFYRRSFHQTSPWLYRVAERRGVYPLIDHYHEPLIRVGGLDSERASLPRRLPGIELRIDAQLALLEGLRYGDELADLSRRGDRLAPTYHNLAFGPGDAEVLYSLIRHLHPSSVLEVGSGHSTRFASAAIQRNAAEGFGGRHVCIEPYESEWLEELDIELIRTPVEDLDVAEFRGLQSGDILFIDSSHVLRPQGDVLFLIHEVLPHLPAGVFIHIHDVFTPRDYPLEWIARRWLWTEQYVVEALLADSSRYEVTLAVNHLFHEHRDSLNRACPILERQPGKPPSSFWIRVR
jgi:Methyltransferase domain